MAEQILVSSMPAKESFMDSLGFPGNWIQWFGQLRSLVNLLSARSVRLGNELRQNPITLGTTTTIAHGIDGLPDYIKIGLQCKTAQFGYVPGDILVMGPFAQAQAGGSGVSVEVTVTDMVVVTAPAFPIVRKDTHAVGDITAANWILDAVPYRLISLEAP